MKTLLLLGGYGSVGKYIARELLKETHVNIVIAGRRKEAAEEFAAVLNGEFKGNRVSARYADASNKESLSKAFKGVDLVMVLTTTPKLIKQIGHAAIESNCDYLDILVNESTIKDLGELAPLIKSHKRVFITQGGFHPGLPAVFVRYGAQFFDRYEKAIIAMAMNAKFERAEQATEIVEMISDFESEVCKDGKWRRATYKDAITMNMGKKFGKMSLYPFSMPEMRDVAKKYNLRESGLYISGFNWFVDWLILPLILITQKIKKGLWVKSQLKLFTWGVNTFSSNKHGAVFLNEAEGIKDGKKKKVRIVAELDDAYRFTAVPVVACVKQYLEGSIRPGIGMMGNIVDEKRLLDDMKKMGVAISIN